MQISCKHTKPKPLRRWSKTYGGWVLHLHFSLHVKSYILCIALYPNIYDMIFLSST